MLYFYLKKIEKKGFNMKKVLIVIAILMFIQSCSILQEYGDNFMRNTGNVKDCYIDNQTGKQHCFWKRDPLK